MKLDNSKKGVITLEIRLNHLKLKNFKGIEEVTLKINGSNATIYGDNGTGKTTVKDAFLWLFFNKDSTDRTKFKIKPQDSKGEDINYLKTIVESGLSINNEDLELKKLFEEKWTKNKETAEAELSGSTNYYWWNEVPVKEMEYKDKIKELINENVFRILTDPFYFNAGLKWQDRRKYLLEMNGDVSDEQVIANYPKLAKLKKILGKHSVEDYKTVVEEKIKEYKKEMADIPPRIDELTLSLPEEGQDYTETEEALKNAKLELQGIDERISRTSIIANEFGNKHRELMMLKSQLEDIKNAIDKKGMEDRQNLSLVKSGMESDRYSLVLTKEAYGSEIKSLELAIERNAVQRAELINEWKELSSSVKETTSLEFVEPDGDSFICPTCKQDLPSNDKEAKLQELKDNFEKEKQSNLDRLTLKLARNNTEGSNLKNDTVEKENRIKTLRNELIKAEKELKELDIKLIQVKETIERQASIKIEPDYNSSPEYVELQRKIKAIEAELEKPYEDTTSRWLKMKDEVLDKINKCNSILYDKKKAELTENKIDELKKKEKEVATLMTELEGHKYLLKQFVISKVSMLEHKINSPFKYVKFKMFDVQMNGDTVETCEALVNTNGSYVPFADANYAGKVNAGLDCINALAAFYDVSAPIFVDNRESISKIIKTNSQIINLVKPPTWNELDELVKKMLIEAQIIEHPEVSEIDDPIYHLDLARQNWDDMNKKLRVELEG